MGGRDLRAVADRRRCPQPPVGSAVETDARMWTAGPFLWTTLWAEKIVEESSRKALRGVAEVT